MAQSRMAVITFLDGDGGNYPSQGLPGAPVYPSQGLPGGPNYPSQGLPGGPNYPSQGLPGFPGFPVHLPVYPFDPTDPGFGVGRPERPDQGLPPSPGHPDQGLPGGGAHPSQPIHDIRPGMRFMVKWLVCGGLILVPDNELPGGGEYPDQGLPPTAQPKK